MMVQSLKFFLGLCVCLLMVSCSESEKERLSRLVQEWDGKEILFPAHSTFTIQGKDTVDFDFQNATFKIVTYVDSTGCMGCKLFLSRWKSFMTKVESIVDKKIVFLFYIHASKEDETYYVTRRESFNYPLCIDENNEFYSLNSFPLEKNYVSFLLDNENRIIQKGNPAYNPNYQEIYMNLLTNKTK